MNSCHITTSWLRVLAAVSRWHRLQSIAAASALALAVLLWQREGMQALWLLCTVGGGATLNDWVKHAMRRPHGGPRRALRFAVAWLALCAGAIHSRQRRRIGWLSARAIDEPQVSGLHPGKLLHEPEEEIGTPMGSTARPPSLRGPVAAASGSAVKGSTSQRGGINRRAPAVPAQRRRALRQRVR